MTTPLPSFVCPHCGAKAKKPRAGETTTCSFCEGELHAPEPVAAEAPPREIIREVVYEVVTLESGAYFRALPSEEQARRRKNTFIALALTLVVCGVALLVNRAKSDSDSRAWTKQFEEKQERKRVCDADCKQKCEAAENAKPKKAAYISSPSAPPDMRKMMDDADKAMFGANITVCSSECTVQSCP